MSIGRSRMVSVVLPGLAVVALAGAALSITRNAADAPRLEPRIAPPGQPDPAVGSVSATGLVEAESEQAGIGAVTPGMVTVLAVSAGQSVRTGDLLFAQDSRAADADLAVRRSQLQAAEVGVAQARSQVPGLRAQIETAQAGTDEAETALADANDLLHSAENTPVGLSITRREVTKRRNDVRIAEARLQEARGRLAQAQAGLIQYQDGDQAGPMLRVAVAAVEQARATLQQAETARALLMVRAPFDGTVLQVNVRLGEYAQVGGAPAIILGQLRTLRLRADIDEGDIPRFSPDARAVAIPRGDPRRQLPLRLLRVEPLVVPKVSLSGAGMERVDTRVLRVVYEIEGPATGLYPGQQLNLFLTARAAVPTAGR